MTRVGEAGMRKNGFVISTDSQARRCPKIIHFVASAMSIEPTNNLEQIKQINKVPEKC